jgi:hypothetical protein
MFEFLESEIDIYLKTEEEVYKGEKRKIMKSFWWDHTNRQGTHR